MMSNEEKNQDLSTEDDSAEMKMRMNHFISTAITGDMLDDIEDSIIQCLDEVIQKRENEESSKRN